jgi:hypothetical protein
MRKAYGRIPNVVAEARAMGAITTVVAVLERS